MLIIQWFLLGMVFIILIYPILESIGTVIITALELVKGILSVKITYLNMTIKKLSNSDDLPKQIIGFRIPDNDENEEDFNEDI